ncbi:hypothetical protein [Planctomyces sp. SH-PL62]|uniref:hypothetical protein n=1 Tax=Planctomyces sp. SH-PL62 TaxID=1636152 RepID=UPI00078BEBF7|nr:hypothetical protein [Planctomyces sp. SH-PL62]AMV40596.1 hypothetical protein VT85_24410 [Planctomyces sp. SH-PL62]
MTDDGRDVEDRLARLREAWPAGSMVDDVMARIDAVEPRPGRGRRRARRLAGLAASGLGLAGVLALAWLILAARPTTLLAAVQKGLERAGSAHLVMTSHDDQGREHRADVWYVKGAGVRMETPDRTIVEDGDSQWSWPTNATEPVATRRRGPGFFSIQLPRMLALQENPDGWRRERSPGLDREIDGRPALGFTFSAPSGQTPGRPAPRALVMADVDERVREIAFEERQDDGTWRRAREIRIEYDPPTPPEKLAFRPPTGAKVLDLDEAFHALHPLDRALRRVELGGLILAVHDVQPLEGRQGFYVVSSVRGTPEFLAKHPPRRRPLNPETVIVEVATQNIGNMTYGGRYVLIGLATAERDGVEYAWWLVVPRRLYLVKDGRREYLPESDDGLGDEPARLDAAPGKARVPLKATYRDPALRDPDGRPGAVSAWAEVPIPADRPPTTIEAVAARARRDLMQLGGGDAGYSLLGVAADAQADGSGLRSISGFLPETLTDADFAAAVRRGLDDLRGFDEVHIITPEEMLPPLGKEKPKE